MRLTLVLHAAAALSTTRRPYDTKVRVASQRSAPLPPTAPQNPTLTEYMRLPTAQYALLDLPYGADLRRKGSSGDQELFELVVPPVKFFFLTVSPHVQCVVDSNEHSVVVRGTSCCLKGTDALVRRINDCFDFRVTAKMTWADNVTTRRIDCAVDLAVDVAPPGPFRLIPRRSLEVTGNSVMRVATNQIIRGFLQTLLNDYSKWASDESYRERRRVNAVSVAAR
jgi:hypothetical protein